MIWHDLAPSVLLSIFAWVMHEDVVGGCRVRMMGLIGGENKGHLNMPLPSSLPYPNLTLPYLTLPNLT